MLVGSSASTLRASACSRIAVTSTPRFVSSGMLALMPIVDVEEPPRWPISVKGVLLRRGAVLLLRNERDEWELPGGRLELGETPVQCVAREFAEETGLAVDVVALLDAWVFEPVLDRPVLIVAYGCTTSSVVQPRMSSEHAEARLFPVDELDRIALPKGYRLAIADWVDRTRDGRAFGHRPQTPEEVGWPDEATSRMIADEPW